MQDFKKEIANRVLLLYGGVFVLALSILGRVFYLQTFGGRAYRAKAHELILEKVAIKPLRGNILSDDGRLLATTVPVYDVHMDMRAPGLSEKQFRKHVDSLSLALSEFSKNKSAKAYKELLLKNYKKGNRFLPLFKGIYHKDLERIKKFPILRNGSNKGGLVVTEHFRRVRPYAHLAQRLIGRISDHKPAVGLEAAYNHYLQGQSGLRLMQKLAGGLMKPASDTYEKEPVPGSDVLTTLNIDLQDVAETELMKKLTESQADHGCVIVMEVATGDVKVMANLKRMEDGTYAEAMNYAIAEAVEPGSTFKLMSLMAALEDGLIQITDSVQTGQGVWIINAQRKLSDVHGGHGRISVKRAFEISSNVGVAKAVYEAYRKQPENFLKRLKAFHLGEPLGIEIPTEATPVIITHKKALDPLSIINKAIGYELRLTPLQILTFYNAVANGGVLVKPRFVREIRQKGRLVKDYPIQVLDSSIARPEVIAAAKEMMEGVVKNGTASALRHSPYSIAGKTGTAWVYQEGKGYTVDGQRKYRASFVGYFPAEAPKYSCLVMITDPQGPVYYGGSLSAPVFKAAADRIYATSFDLHKPVNETPVAMGDTNHPKVKIGKAAQAALVLNALNITNGFSKYGTRVVGAVFDTYRFRAREVPPTPARVLPDLRGYSPRAAVAIVEEKGGRPVLEGRGAVVEQDPPPGVSLGKNQIVKLKLG
ncbi:MAG: transpeptidase family protein [Flavobacteriales bacterium]|nr:transpeptidase family protein [Flavobacteriales bacterium]MCX7649962.1 transpeptidase family protein [Flavobacteriales bacterium]MDW8432321.1 penicillin-binding protein [Flavobacteriales bacterium]